MSDPFKSVIIFIMSCAYRPIAAIERIFRGESYAETIAQLNREMETFEQIFQQELAEVELKRLLYTNDIEQTPDPNADR